LFPQDLLAFKKTFFAMVMTTALITRMNTIAKIQELSVHRNWIPFQTLILQEPGRGYH